jgi:Mg2+-importing ATPase
MKSSSRQITQTTPADYWSITPADLLSTLKSTEKGLAQREVEQRLKQYGLNALEKQRQATALILLLSQFKSPLVLILIFAAIISDIVGEWTDASIVLAVVLGSTILGFVQEYSASNAVEKLRSRVTIKSNVLRDGQPKLIPSEQIVPGDVVLLSAGSLIPADGILLSAKDFFANQAVLTGETFPVEKKPETVAAKASRQCHKASSQSHRTNQLRIHGHKCRKRHCTSLDCSNGESHHVRSDRGAPESASAAD